MLVLVGLTIFEIVFVNVTSLYQVTVPPVHAANKVELLPEQIVSGLAEIPVGAVGVGFTVIAILPVALLQPDALTQAT